MELMIYSNVSYYSLHRTGRGELVWRHNLSMSRLLLVINIYTWVILRCSITVLCSWMNSFCLGRRAGHLQSSVSKARKETIRSLCVFVPQPVYCRVDGTCFFVLLGDFCFILFLPSKRCPDGDGETCVLGLPHGPCAAHTAVPSSLSGSMPTCSPSPLVLCSFTVLKLSVLRFSGRWNFCI